MRALVLLAVPEGSRPRDFRFGSHERARAVAERRAALAALLRRFEGELAALDGRIGQRSVSAAGAVQIEAPAGAIERLASLPYVEAIIEDQRVTRSAVHE